MDEKVSEKVITGKTLSGFAFSVNEAALDDYELLEDLVLLDSGQSQVMVRVLNTILGADQTKRLKEHCRDENGKVALSDMERELIAIFNAHKTSKNSERSPA